MTPYYEQETTLGRCPCCGEWYEQTMDGVQCACEWEGCDEDCPHVGPFLRAKEPS